MKVFPNIRIKRKYTNSYIEIFVYSRLLFDLPFGAFFVILKQWPRGGVVTQRSAKPRTPVQFRPWPPKIIFIFL